MLCRLRLTNFKSWPSTGDIAIKPITGFFGTNSAGKSSLFQALLLMKQTEESLDQGITVFHFGDYNTLVDLGNYKSVIHRHDSSKKLELSLGWQSRGFALPRSYGGGRVQPGTAIEFEVRASSGAGDSEQSSILDAMSYSLPDGRTFGMRRRSSGAEYEVFARSSTEDFKFYNVTPPSFPPIVKCSWFPPWAREPRKAPNRVFFDLSYSLRVLLNSIHYLGPLRARASRIYARSGAHPIDMGQAGELVVDALLSARERRQVIPQTSDSPSISIDDYVSQWLVRLGLADEFRVKALAEGRRWFELEMRKTSGSVMVAMTDVGIGVSQILPVLALCFYVRPRSTIVLEQPEIHLHPSAQSGLADVFADAWKTRGVQTLFESHSEHLLRRLQRRIAEGAIDDDDVALYFCSTDPNGNSRINELVLDEFGNIANWPKDFFGDQFGEVAAMSDAALKRRGK